jgi:hypothetical protein
LLLFWKLKKSTPLRRRREAWPSIAMLFFLSRLIYRQHL